MSSQADGPVGNFLERKLWKHDDISYLPAVKYGLVSESTTRLLFERDMSDRAFACLRAVYGFIPDIQRWHVALTV